MKVTRAFFESNFKQKIPASVRRFLAFHIALAAISTISILPCLSIDSTGDTHPQIITLKENGGWCWFEDDRTIVDQNRLILGTVKSPEGDIDVTTYDWKAGTAQTVTLHKGLESDDHDSPALLILPNGQYLAAYSRHGSDKLMRWRISTRAGDATEWNPEQIFDVGAGATYSNLFCLKDENNRIYDFHRGIGWDPNFLISDDLGQSWRYGGQLLKNPNDPDNQMRPYLKYASNQKDTIHFIATEAHPQQSESTGIYHGFIRNGTVFRSDGTRVRELIEGPADPGELTRIFHGSAQEKAWTIDLHLDAEDNPYLVYSVHLTNDDHRYRYARWDGQKWLDQELAHAGTRLYRGEEHYTGLAALDPHEPNRLYISTNAHPVTGQPLFSQKDGKRHYEIFLGTLKDGETAWNWIPITKNSDLDNLRPIIPAGNNRHRAVLWLRGKYNSYTDYDLDVVGIMENK